MTYVDLAKQLDESKVAPGLLGFVVILAIGLALWVLSKSMSKQMHKIDFEEPAPAKNFPLRTPESTAETSEAAPGAAKRDVARSDSETLDAERGADSSQSR